ncbi:hypothetical protein GBA52_006243 [Prunus armeniaca]|nr:hypothetical protein GBA52_006243 [Prunus armeniaca]
MGEMEAEVVPVLGFSETSRKWFSSPFSVQASTRDDHHKAATLELRKEFGLSSSAETSAFAEDIFARVPRKESGSNVSCYSKLRILASSLICHVVSFLLVTRVYQLYQKQEREAAMLRSRRHILSWMQMTMMEIDLLPRSFLIPGKLIPIRNDSGRRS